MRNFASPVRSIACVAILTAGASAQAESVTLSSLLDGGTVTSGELTFSDFNYSALLNAPDASNIGVLDIDGGIRFGSVLSVTGDEVLDFRVGFTVSAASPITDVTLSSIASIGGDGQVVIIERVDDAETGAGLASFSNVYDGDVFLPITTASISGDLNSLVISKDVGLAANGSFANLSDFTQIFSTGGAVTAVPSPSAAVAGMLGMVGLLVRRRRNAA